MEEEERWECEIGVGRARLSLSLPRLRRRSHRRLVLPPQARSLLPRPPPLQRPLRPPDHEEDFDLTADLVLRQLIVRVVDHFQPKPTTGVIAGPRDGLSAQSIARFLLPASDCEFTLNSVLEELQRDPWQVPADQRATRCTSTALSVAASLLGACVPGSGARIMAFIGGPSTKGQGAVRTPLVAYICSFCYSNLDNLTGYRGKYGDRNPTVGEIPVTGIRRPVTGVRGSAQVFSC
ncbi:hypothetical protein ACLB2K_069367 [Fragaria x ananassa]